MNLLTRARRASRTAMDVEMFLLAIAGRLGVGPFARRRSPPHPGPWRHLWIVAALLGALACTSLIGDRP